MTFSKQLGLALVAASALGAPAMAQDYLALGGGAFNALRDNNKATLFSLEYRANPWAYNVRPVVGAFVTTDSSVYGYAGINWDVELLANQLYLIPNFAVGAYGDGNGKDLGGALEFRSGIELDYQLPNTHRIGIGINHLSNASIYDHNPGEENIIVNYSVPISSIFGR